MKREVLFKTETDLCAAFLAWLKRYPDWVAYAETEGWDILLAHRDGTQIGIQAKLIFNMKVLSQAVEDGGGWSKTGPDYRAVLVPQGQGWEVLCSALGLTLIQARKGYRTEFEFNPSLDEQSWTHWHYCNPEKRHPLPAYIPDVAAGASAPCVLTKWKIGALEICAVIEIRGHVTRTDFKIAGVDHRRWVESWLEPVTDIPGAWTWKKATGPMFLQAHKEVYPQVLAKVRERLVI